MNGNAMHYELIIRRAHKVGRFGNLAANADNFRLLERYFVTSRDNKDPQKDHELSFRYAFHCGEIATNLANALDHFEKDYKNQLSEADNEVISKINSLLSEATIEKIDETIGIFETLFARHNVIL